MGVAVVGSPHKLFDDHLDIVFGRVFSGVDFAASPLYCDFMTLAICGHLPGPNH